MMQKGRKSHLDTLSRRAIFNKNLKNGILCLLVFFSYYYFNVFDETKYVNVTNLQKGGQALFHTTLF